MSFLLSLVGSFLGAFFVIFWKVYIEENSHKILAYEDTWVSFQHAHDYIFGDGCLDPQDDDPPVKATVAFGLREYFDKKYLRYVGLYSQRIQIEIDDLRAIYLSIGDPEFLIRYGKNSVCEDYSTVDRILRDIPELCEGEIKIRRKNLLFRFWWRLKNILTSVC